MPQATVKSYDSLTRTGVLISDDGSATWTIDPAAMDSGMFRFLRPGQRVTFEVIEEAGAQAIRNLRIGIG